MHPSAFGHPRQNVGQTCGGDGTGLELLEPSGWRCLSVEVILVHIPLPQMPIEVPHVLAPADDLSDEPFDAV
jgi:hypothetical protein